VYNCFKHSPVSVWLWVVSSEVPEDALAIVRQETYSPPPPPTHNPTNATGDWRKEVCHGGGWMVLIRWRDDGGSVLGACDCMGG